MIKKCMLSIVFLCTNLSFLLAGPVGFGTSYIVMLDVDGQVWVKGSNFYGQIGLGQKMGVEKFTKLDLPIPIKSVACGVHYFTILLDVEGYVWSFGAGSKGQLGLGEVKGTNYPNKIESITNVIKIAPSFGRTTLLDEQGNVSSCGKCIKGSLCLGEIKKSTKPRRIEGINTNIVHIVSGKAHTILLDGSGLLWSFGDNKHGQCGRLSADYFGTINFIEVKEISAGKKHTIILDSMGCVWSFGSNSNGQLGLGNCVESSSMPTQIENLDSIMSICSGIKHNVLQNINGEVIVFGCNTKGELGLGKEIDVTYVPTKLDLPFLAQVVFAGFHSTIVVDESDLIWYCGFGPTIGDGGFDVFKPKKLDLPFQMMLETRKTQIKNACNVAINKMQ